MSRKISWNICRGMASLAADTQEQLGQRYIRCAGRSLVPGERTPSPATEEFEGVDAHLQPGIGVRDTKAARVVKVENNLQLRGHWSCASVYGLLMEPLTSWPSWTSARARSHSRLGPEGHMGHLITNALARPFLHLLIPTRGPRRESQLLLSGSA